MNKEIKRVVANPSEEEACIKHYQEWGWTLKFRNEVLAKDMHFDNATMVTFGHLNLGKVNSHEEVTNYVSMLFERDLENPKIARLAELEVEIPKLEETVKDSKKKSDKAKENTRKRCGRSSKPTSTISIIGNEKSSRGQSLLCLA
jgi:hypothetical protein